MAFVGYPMISTILGTSSTATSSQEIQAARMQESSERLGKRVTQQADLGTGGTAEDLEIELLLNYLV